MNLVRPSSSKDGQQDSPSKKIVRAAARIQKAEAACVFDLRFRFGLDPCSAAKPTTASTQQTTLDATSRFGAEDSFLHLNFQELRFCALVQGPMTLYEPHSAPHQVAALSDTDCWKVMLAPLAEAGVEDENKKGRAASSEAGQW